MKHSLRDGAGYLIIDHRDSPGLNPQDLPERLRDVAVPAGTAMEWDYFACAHCQTRVLINPDRVRPRGYCHKCDHYLCDNPVCNSTCAPVKKLFDRIDTAISRGEEPLIILTD